MTEISRKTRRMAGMLSARVPEIGLAQVADARSRRGIRWQKLKPLLAAPPVAMAAGLKSFAETEKLTMEMSRAMRRKLGISRRIPDTTEQPVQGVHRRVADPLSHRRDGAFPQSA